MESQNAAVSLPIASKFCGSCHIMYRLGQGKHTCLKITGSTKGEKKHFAQMMKYVLSTSNRQYCRNCQHCHQNLDYEFISAKVAKTQQTHQWLDVQRHNKLYNFCSHCLKCAMLIPKPPALPVLAPAISQPIPVLAPALPELAPAISQPIPVLAPALPQLAPALAELTSCTKCELFEKQLKLEAKEDCL